MDYLYGPFLMSAIICALIMPILIPVLRRLKFGQTIREVGPSWHKKKNGTPTMGGIGFFISTLAAFLVYTKGNMENALLFACCAGFFLIGFADDFIKVILKRNLGLDEKQKLFFQTALSVVFLFFAKKMGIIDTALSVPFTDFSIELGWFYYIFATGLIVGFSNAVNLTDGVDGLASSVTFIVCIFFALFAMKINKLEYVAVPAAVAGGLLGFLFYNSHPARVFMGDTGSLFLGGVVSLISIALGYEILLLPVGFIYLAEAVSVMIQVFWFKRTGKRVFLMTPIHHHYEKKGWSEKKICAVFSTITVVFCLICYFA
ncbi:MAG: phospho-N-acetylmuramoyl-pentapeptide-transferase [Clostridia bacterium]|nr:phospho-N-acetylmuramoyl-pentapeptide-transferase [Clostridia bacterium]